MKKFLCFICSLAIILLAIVPGPDGVYAAPSVSISVNKSTVNVGDKITVTVSITNGYAAQGYVSASSGVTPTGDQVFVIGTPAGQSNSMSFTYTATSEGSCSFSASVSEAYDAEMNEVSLSGASASVNIANGNEADNSGNQASDNKNSNDKVNDSTDNNNNDEKSSDTTLKSLYISNGTLEPAFSSGTRNYSTKVDYSVTNIAISASPSNSKASISSVSGNDSLEVGDNIVKIVVKAENGSTGTYKINVTRRTEDDPENSNVNKEPVIYNVNGNNWQIVNEIPQDNIPEGFELSSVVIKDQEFACLNSTFGDLILLYMTTEDGTNFSYLVYDQKQDVVYDFVKIFSEQHFIIVLMPSIDELPETYVEENLSIEGKGVITAYAHEVYESEFYYVYAMNDLGKKNWYMYDSVEGTYIRCELEDENTKDISQDEKPEEKKATEKDDDNTGMIIIFSLAFLVLIFLYVIVCLLKKLRKADEELVEDDYEDGFDFEDKDDLEDIFDSDKNDYYKDIELEENDDNEEENDDFEQLNADMIGKLAAEVEALASEKSPELIKDESDEANELKDL